MNQFEIEVLKNKIKNIEGIEVLNIFPAVYTVAPISEDYIVFYMYKEEMFCFILNLQQPNNNSFRNKAEDIKKEISREAKEIVDTIVFERIMKTPTPAEKTQEKDSLLTYIINTLMILEVLGLHNIDELEYRRKIKTIMEELYNLDNLTIYKETLKRLGINMNTDLKERAKKLQKELVEL